MERFFWMSQQEIDTLMKTRGEDWRVYLCLRKRANFETGWLDHYSAKKMTSASIGREISLPSSSGVPVLEMTRKDVSRSLVRLIGSGLIDGLSREKNFLRLRLPLIKANTKEEKASQSRLSQTEGEKRSRMSRVETAIILPVKGVADGTGAGVSQDDPQLALIVSHAETAESAQILAFQRIAGNEIDTVNNKNKNISKPPISEGENHSPSAGKTHTPALRACNQKPEKSRAEKPDAANRVRDIVATVGKDANGHNLIRNLYTERSKIIFRGLAGFDERDIREAVRNVLSNTNLPPSPESIDSVLRSKSGVHKRSETSRMKGWLAL